MKWNQALQAGLNLFLCSTCPLCGRTAAGELCQDCQRQIKSCQILKPGQSWQRELPVFSWGMYGGALKRAIAALKYDHQPQLARPLGQWLAQAWLSSKVSHSQLTVVPIPLHPVKQQRRGYNQAALLARSFCDYTGLPLRCQGLERLRQTQAQFGLSISEREQNLAQAFRLGRGFSKHCPAQSVLLLDDIYTTGATARAAIKTLQGSGIPVEGLVTAAFAKQLRDQ